MVPGTGYRYRNLLQQPDLMELLEKVSESQVQKIYFV